MSGTFTDERSVQLWQIAEAMDMKASSSRTTAEKLKYLKLHSKALSAFTRHAKFLRDVA